MGSLEKIGKGALITAVGGVIIGCATLFAGAIGDFWGSRGISDVYKFKLQGAPASVKRDDRILAEDKYWIQLGENRIYNTNGPFKTDNGSKVYVGGSWTNTYFVVEEQR
ncbi:MAG: hypothetical protein V1889_01790 [archaeon]